MKIDRLIGILSILLQQEKVTAPYLAGKFEVSRRTINRDVENLCQAGIPIVTEQGVNGGISIMEGYKLEKTLLTSSELQAILTGLKSLDSVSGSNKYGLLMDKLSVHHSSILASNNHVLIDLSYWNTKALAPKIELIQSATENHQLITFAYYAPNGESTRTIEPYVLVFQWLCWYVWGYCRLRQGFRLFKLSRMEQLTGLKEGFEPRRVPDFDDIPVQIYNPDSLRVSAVFDKAVKWRLIEEFGQEQLHEMEDGRYYLEFGWSDKQSLFSYLLGFQESVQLLEPEYLREEFAALTRRISQKYD